MASKIQWESVAHYYAFSNIMGELSWGPNSGKTSKSKTPAELTIGRIAPIREGDISFKPILRDLDDMTDAEIEEAHIVEWGEPIDIGDSPLQYRSRVEWLQGYDGHFSPALFAYLISRGFDVFRLIETGQAIRKEVAR